MVICWRHGHGIEPRLIKTFRHFREIINAETDLDRRKKYECLLYGTYTALALWILVFLAVGLYLYFTR